MRSPLAALSVLFLLYAPLADAHESMCGTGPEHDTWLRSVLSRPRDPRPIESHALPAAPQLRNGAFYVAADEEIVPGHRPFNLEQQSLVFEPRSADSFAVRREGLQYREPQGAPVRDFEVSSDAYVHDLSFELPIFGRSVTRVFITRFNTIEFEPPAATRAGSQVGDVEAAVERRALVSPLMIAAGKPRQLAYPALFVEETPSGLAITWRSTEGEVFGYDVQAELRQDGGVIFSYRSLGEMRWGAPLLTAGFDPATAARQPLHTATDAAGDLSTSLTPAVRAMLDILESTVARVADSDVLSIRVKFAGPVTQAPLASGQTIRYIVRVDGEDAVVELTSTQRRFVALGTHFYVAETPTVNIDGDTIEFFIPQRVASAESVREVFVQALILGTSTRDVSSFSFTSPPAPRRVATDFTTLPAGTELSLPITQPFLLGTFDPFVTWERVKSAFPISDHAIDAVAMYQSFHTDLIFYAGAYATAGNAQVGGTEPDWPFRGIQVPRSPTLLHMNQFTFNYNSEERRASRVLLHELGHRWLSFFSIRENGTASSVINPTGSHPAGYVHLPSAFPLYGAEESSVMGGGYFRQEGGSWRTVALNDGYSWSDLYIMGLAAAEEVPPWFYLANTNPFLPNAYWPPHDVTVTGQRREVTISQLIDVHGPRNPSAGLSQRQFRVLFVLVTEGGQEPTAAEVARIDELRALLERNFAIATGGRGSIRTSFVQPSRQRTVR